MVLRDNVDFLLFLKVKIQSSQRSFPIFFLKGRKSLSRIFNLKYFPQRIFRNFFLIISWVVFTWRKYLIEFIKYETQRRVIYLFSCIEGRSQILPHYLL